MLTCAAARAEAPAASGVGASDSLIIDLASSRRSGLAAGVLSGVGRASPPVTPTPETSELVPAAEGPMPPGIESAPDWARRSTRPSSASEILGFGRDSLGRSEGGGIEKRDERESSLGLLTPPLHDEKKK